MACGCSPFVGLLPQSKYMHARLTADSKLTAVVNVFAFCILSPSPCMQLTGDLSMVNPTSCPMATRFSR